MEAKIQKKQKIQENQNQVVIPITNTLGVRAESAGSVDMIDVSESPREFKKRGAESSPEISNHVQVLSQTDSDVSSQGPSSQESNFSDESYDYHQQQSSPQEFDQYKVGLSNKELDNRSNKKAKDDIKAAVLKSAVSTSVPKAKATGKTNIGSLLSRHSQSAITADQCDQLLREKIKITAKPILNEILTKNIQENKDRANELMLLFYSYIGPIDACYPAIDLIGIRNLNAIFKKIDETSSWVDYIYLKYETNTSIIDEKFLGFYANIMEFNLQIKQNILKRTQLMATLKITQTETQVKKANLADNQETKEYLNRLYNANKKLTGIVEQSLPYDPDVLEQYMTIQDDLFVQLYATREERKKTSSPEVPGSNENHIAQQIAKNVNDFRKTVGDVDHPVSEIKIDHYGTHIVIPNLIYDELFHISRELSYNSAKYEIIIKGIYSSLRLTSSAQTYNQQLKAAASSTESSTASSTASLSIQLQLDMLFNQNQILINGMDAGHDMTTFTVLEKVHKILTYILVQSSSSSGGGGLPNIDISKTIESINAILSTGTSSNCINVKKTHEHTRSLFEDIRSEIKIITGISDVPNSYNTEISISKEDMVDVMSVEGLFYPESGRRPPPPPASSAVAAM